MAILKSSKYSKTTAELTFTTQKANTCSRPWTTCFVFDWKYPFWENFSLSWNLVLGLFKYAELHGDVHFFYIRLIILSWANLVEKIKIVSLCWNLVPTLIRICVTQWWYPLFLFLTINILLGQIWSKNWKLFVQSEIWYKD